MAKVFCVQHGEIRDLVWTSISAGGTTARARVQRKREEIDGWVRQEEQAQVTQVLGYEWGVGAEAGVSGKEARAWGAERPGTGAARNTLIATFVCKLVATTFDGVDLSLRHIRRVGPTNPNCCRCRASLERLSWSASSRRLCFCNVCCLVISAAKGAKTSSLLAESYKLRQHRVRVFCRLMSKLHQGRVVLRGDCVKNDMGFQSISAEQGWRNTRCSFCLHSSTYDGCSPSSFSRFWRRPANFDRIVDVPVVPLGSNLFCDPLAGFLWARKLEKIP